MSKFANFLIGFLGLVLVTSTTGCSSKVVPPGNIVIVLKSNGDTTIYTKGSYIAWGRDRVYFVETKLKSFTERMKILCEDNINMNVDVKWIGSFKVTKNDIKIIKEKVPAIKLQYDGNYSLSLNKFYNTAVKDIIRANSRYVVSKYKTEVIREKRIDIQNEIKNRILKRLEELRYPIVTTDIMISNLDYPKEITEQRKAIKRAQLENEKQAALAKAAIEQAKREAGIAREKGKAQIERAKADALANKIRSESLTPEIIQMRQWDVLENLAGNSNLMIVPYEALGNTLNAALLKKAIDINKQIK